MANEKARHALRRAQFLSFRFWKGGERSFVFSVPNVFPSSFQRCSQNTSILLSHILWQKLNFHIDNYKGGLKGTIYMLLFWAVPNVSKKLVTGK